LRNLAIAAKNGQPILLRQIAEVTFAAAIKRGDAGFEGKPAVILGVQKQPTADTTRLTQSIEEAISDLKASLPAGMEAPRVTFRQANFIEASISTLQGKLIGASVFVAAILFFFLGTVRPTIIALTAIPISIFITALVFKYFGLSINTMTLGGLAIAIGGLVDDAVVDVENILRRLKEDRAKDASLRLSLLSVPVPRPLIPASCPCALQPLNSALISPRHLLTLSISLSSLCSLRHSPLLHSPAAIATCVCRAAPVPVPRPPPSFFPLNCSPNFASSVLLSGEPFFTIVFAHLHSAIHVPMF
jgi:hypothetical protein